MYLLWCWFSQGITGFSTAFLEAIHVATVAAVSRQCKAPALLDSQAFNRKTRKEMPRSAQRKSMWIDFTLRP